MNEFNEKIYKKACVAGCATLNRELEAAHVSGLEHHLKTLKLLLTHPVQAMGFVRLLIAMSHQAHACSDSETHKAAIRVAFALLVQIEGERLTREESKHE